MDRDLPRPRASCAAASSTSSRCSRPTAGCWPVFNVADSAIVCGGILGALLALRGIEFDGTRAAEQDARPTPSDPPPDAGARRRGPVTMDAVTSSPGPAPRPAGARRARGAAGRPGAVPAVRADPRPRPPSWPTPAAWWSTAGRAARATGSPAAAGWRSSCPPPPGEPVAPRPVEGMTILYDDDDLVVVDKPVGRGRPPEPRLGRPDGHRRAGRGRLPRSPRPARPSGRASSTGWTPPRPA